MLRKAWPAELKEGSELNEKEKDEILLKHLLTWPTWPGFLKFFGKEFSVECRIDITNIQTNKTFAVHVELSYDNCAGINNTVLSRSSVLAHVRLFVRPYTSIISMAGLTSTLTWELRTGESKTTLEDKTKIGNVTYYVSLESLRDAESE